MATIKPRFVSWSRRLGWLVLIWLGSVLALGVVAGTLRLLMHAAGMSSH
ncbi:hypothetical protein J2Y86_000258 [Pseudomonas migulae]|nr:DUF2474 domain-containing protein [Pseudomonas migulae]MCP1495551.1 hypothetical protein [Pseudomonas migulae]